MKKIFNEILKNRGYSYLSPKVEVKKSGIQGKGMFAKAAFKKGEIVNIAAGFIIDRKEFEKIDKTETDFLDNYSFPVAEGFYMISFGGNLEKDDFFNHSCNPNCGMKGQIIFVAMRDIKKGEELTFDYAMTDANSDDFLICNCGAKNCRKKIRGDDWKLPELQKRYKGYFSWYIEEKIRNLKKINRSMPASAGEINRN